jgi:hypothetical protein
MTSVARTTRRMVSSELAALAEDPELFVAPPEGTQHVARDRYRVVIGPHRRWAGVCRLRLSSRPDELAREVAEIRGFVAGIETVLWNVGSSARPESLPDRLHELGLRHPDPPMDHVCAAMVLTEEPPQVGGVDVRRISTLEEHHAGLEIMLATAGWTARRPPTNERTRAAETFERRMRRGGHEWLAWMDGRPVARALANRSAHGLFLAGGATLPEARAVGATERSSARAGTKPSVLASLAWPCRRSTARRHRSRAGSTSPRSRRSTHSSRRLEARPSIAEVSPTTHSDTRVRRPRA